MAITVRQIVDQVGVIAPWELAEDWDNVGLLAGHPDWPVERVLVALDLNEDVLDRAEEIRADVIVTHHPILFNGTKTLREDDPEEALIARLVRAKIALITAHTNYDNAPDGLNGALAEALGIKQAEPLEQGLRIGEWAASLGELAEYASETLGDVVRVYGDENRAIPRVAVCGGAGGEFWPIAKAAGADAFLTGEIKYHDALSARANGLCILEAGHRATEAIAMKALKRDLQMRMDTIQYNVMVFGEWEKSAQLIARGSGGTES